LAARRTALHVQAVRGGRSRRSPTGDDYGSGSARCGWPTIGREPGNGHRRTPRPQLLPTLDLLDRAPPHLARTHRMIPLARVQEIDRRAMTWLVRQPGETTAERAGNRQRISAIAREENFDTWKPDSSQLRTLAASSSCGDVANLARAEPALRRGARCFVTLRAMTAASRA